MKEIVRRAEKAHSAVATTDLIVAGAAAVPAVIAAEVLVEVVVEEVLGGAVADARKSVGRFWQR